MTTIVRHGDLASIADLETGVLKNPEAIAEYQLGYDTKKKAYGFVMAIR